MAKRTVFLTGANRGIGLELARQLIEAGNDVWCSAREQDPAALAALSPAGIVRLDLGDDASIDAATATLRDRLDHLDLLVNCAGVNATAAGAAPDQRGVLDITPDQFEYVQRVNVIAPMMVTRGVLPLLRNGTEPLVINISSQLGSLEFSANSGTDVAYNASKAALNMVSVRTAAELAGDGVSVVMLHPGWVSSDMGGAAAPLTPADSAAAMIATISALKPADSGRFLRWDGTTHPW